MKLLDSILKNSLLARRKTLFVILLAVGVASVLRLFIFGVYRVPTGAMVPTLWPGDFILTWKLYPEVKLPLLDLTLFESPIERGDIVAFRCPEEKRLVCLKRVAALGGDRVEMTEKGLVVNEITATLKEEPTELELIEGKVFEEELLGSTRRVLISEGPPSVWGPMIVPQGEIFLIGDNRRVADDSRSWGSLKKSEVLSKALFIWLSLSWSDGGAEINHQRLFKGIH